MKTVTKDHGRGETVREYFSRRSQYWDSLYVQAAREDRFTRYELKHRKEVVLDLIVRPRGAKECSALDLGCGAGQYTASLAMMGFDCCGVDVSGEMLQLARAKIPVDSAVKWICSDCRQVPAEDHCFDFILCVGVLEYLEDDIAALYEIRRLIKPDGQVILSFPNLYKLRNILNPYYYLVRVWTYLFSGNKSQKKSDDVEAPLQLDFCKSVVRRYRLKTINHMAAEAAFNVTAVRSCCFGPFSLWKQELLPLKLSIKFSMTLERLTRCRGWGFLRFFANRWVVVLRAEAAG
ncbi:MAG: class I SAM-dependent methyltransferase [Spartobacteria bacterium]|nr:class I SAM-dependent methyltransferase [Spartobacteria bacterium]